MSNVTDEKSNVDEDLKKLIPQKKTIVIGIDNPREYQIMPKLSFRKQTYDVPELFDQVIKTFFEYRNLYSGLEIEEEQIKAQMRKTANKIFESIRDNIFKILALFTGLNKEILDDISNDQLLYVIEMLFKENYEDTGKNAIALVSRAKKAFSFQKS